MAATRQPGADALDAIRRARRARRAGSIDPVEALYRAYVAAILAGIALWLLSGVVGGTRVGPAGAARVAAHAGPVVGLAVAAILAVGLRSGGKGGPLALEAADVRHVLLSPVDRALALRPQAWRQMRSAAVAAAGVGALAGLLAYRRLPGEVVAWLAAGAVVAALAVLAGFGVALVVSGLRLGRAAGTLLAVVALGWSAADVLTGTVTSPMSLLGEVAVWPLRFRPLGVLGVLAVGAAVAGGLVAVGGSSIEAAERRSSLVGQLRFAATLRDLRTVVVLRRQLAQELPRQRPWVRLPPAVRLPPDPPTGRGARGLPSWRRGWHGIVRFPALRLGRMAALGVVAGLAGLGAWRGTTPLVVVAGIALYIAALDAVEPVAQEADHPDRRDGYGIEAGELYLREAGPSLVAMAVVGLVGAVAAAAAGGGLLAFEVGATLALPAAAAAVVGALLSTVQGPPSLFSATDSLMPPEMAGVKNLVRTVLPPAVAVVGVLPLLAGRHPAPHLGPLGATAATLPEVLFVALLALSWVRYRDRAVEWWHQSMEEAQSVRGQGRQSAGPRGR